jgi:CheY-like chemotaxis protein
MMRKSVVEDQEDLRGILRALLTGSGYDVAEAADGRRGVAKAKSERPDLILMDIQLPILDGYEATRQIKADPNLKATPIIQGCASSCDAFAKFCANGKLHLKGCPLTQRRFNPDAATVHLDDLLG